MENPDFSFSMQEDKKKRVTPWPIAVSPVKQFDRIKIKEILENINLTTET
jgi:hypothetical protein